MSIIQKAMEKKSASLSKKTVKSSSDNDMPQSSELLSGQSVIQDLVHETDSANIQSLSQNVEQEAFFKPVHQPVMSDGFPQAWRRPATIEIDSERLRDLGMVSHTDKQVNPGITNEFRAIKQKLFHTAFGSGAQFQQRANLLMVTSVSPREGKTFTAVNLALSMASEKDKTVLLVDANVLKPGVSDMLGIQAQAGLIDFLQGSVTHLSEIIYPTSIPNLRLIPAGKPHHLSNELLASNKMEKLMNELAHRYPDRMVIFDCPPLLGIVETMTLSKLLGQALVVVEQDRSRLDDVEVAVSQLNKDMAIGFVMNKAVRNVFGQYRHGHEYGATEDQS
ncbi:AAA family ATPase [Photobacterium sp. CAU 1568]|uniref:non-specific protein-tyrosine kinase n=1 Tax=Photobacterium arenosum TaxID=2774143 RepID=A0ABR9BNR5_9GAMM|nr:XrtA-associated tyrosine autokinase [Photobacterium arenosum]MBD8514213.1 AAA family ATPase [Photobacterium arenosum]